MVPAVYVRCSMRKEQKKINGLRFKLVEYKTIACRIDRRAGSVLIEICIFVVEIMNYFLLMKTK